MKLQLLDDGTFMRTEHAEKYESSLKKNNTLQNQKRSLGAPFRWDGRDKRIS